MDAANLLCRFLLIAAALAAVIGCQSDSAGVKARGQLPQDPLAPIAPPPMPPPSSETPTTPGVVPAIPGGPVIGSPVPQYGKGPVVNTGFTSVKTLPTTMELLKASTPRVRVVAIVGANNVITDQEVRESVWQQNEELVSLQGAERDAKMKELYTLALRRTIERELILDDMYSKLKKANKMGVIEEIRDFASQATDRQIREIKKKIGAKSDDDFSEFLRLQGLTVPVLRRQFERQLMAQQYLNSMFKEKSRRVGLLEIRDYYDKHPEEFKTADRVKWQHIFISFRNHATAQAAYAHAEAIRQKAAAGADFAALSKQFDNGYAANQNGFGTGEERSKIEPGDLEATVWALKPGQMSGLIQTPTGYHIVKVVERAYAGVQPFDAKVQSIIRDKLTESLIATETKKLVEELWRKGVVRVMTE